MLTRTMVMRPHRLKYLLILTGGTLTLVCLAGLMIAVLSQFTVQLSWARQRWEQHRPQHYQFEAVVRSGRSFNDRVLVEVRGRQIIGGVHLDTGRPLDQRDVVARFVVIDDLLKMLADEARSTSRWRTQLARAYPLLADWLDPCARPFPEVQYDPDFGYPTDITYPASLCLSTFVPRSSVTITRFHPLP